MPEQILWIEPEHELKFKGPFNVPSTTLLKLTNPSGKRVVFKIKTTAPKRYCVRPNNGVLEPGTNANIAVVFQPCELEPAGYKHKFMVQALYAPSEGEVNQEALWKDVDSTKLMDTKLRCTFEMPAGADSGNQNNDNEEEKALRAKFSEGDAAADAEPVVYELPEATAFVSNAVPEDNRGDTTARVQPAESSQLKKENMNLKDELDRLKRQLKSREASGSMGTAMQSASPPAIPMVYIVLTLVAILIGLIMGKFIL